MKNITKLFVFVFIITMITVLLSCETSSPKDELIYTELTHASPNSINLVDNGINIFHEPTIPTTPSYVEMNLHSDHIMFIKYYETNGIWDAHKYTVFYEDISHYSFNKNCLTILL